MYKVTRHFGGAHILLVEDFVVNEEIAVKMLETMGCNVQVATDGHQAIDLFNKGKFSLILMDIQVPELDGYEVTQHIRQQEGEGSRIPIIALTANALEGDKTKCLNAGMDDYLNKPLKINRLETMLSKHLRIF